MLAAEVVAQLDRLTEFEKIALRQLIIRGMTGMEFYQFVKDLGLPVLTLPQQHAIAETFQKIAEHVTFLRQDDFEVWTIGPEVRHVAGYALRSRLRSA